MRLAQEIAIGIIGMGWMGAVHARSYRQIPDRFPDSGIRPRLVICCDDVAARAQEAQSRLGFECHTTHWQEVINHPEVRVVDITSPNCLHFDIVRAAAEAGKHVSCEKPLGRSPEETCEIEAIARRAGILTFTGYNYRWAPLVQYARQLIQEGRLGKITHYRGRFFAGYGADPEVVLSWRFQHTLAGSGALGDIVSHVIDMAHFLAGPIVEVVSTCETFIQRRPLAIEGMGTAFTAAEKIDQMGKVTNEDYVGALVRFANGARGTFEGCRVITGPKSQMAFELNGTGGAVSWDLERLNELHLFLRDRPEHDGYTRICSGPDHRFHANFNPGPGINLSYEDLKAIEAFQFLKCVRDEVQGEPGFHEALAVAEVQAAMIRSWKSGSWERVGTIQQDPHRDTTIR